MCSINFQGYQSRIKPLTRSIKYIKLTYLTLNSDYNSVNQCYHNIYLLRNLLVKTKAHASAFHSMRRPQHCLSKFDCFSFVSSLFHIPSQSSSFSGFFAFTESITHHVMYRTTHRVFKFNPNIVVSILTGESENLLANLYRV